MRRFSVELRIVGLLLLTAGCSTKTALSVRDRASGGIIAAGGVSAAGGSGGVAVSGGIGGVFLTAGAGGAGGGVVSTGGIAVIDGSSAGGIATGGSGGFGGVSDSGVDVLAVGGAGGAITGGGAGGRGGFGGTLDGGADVLATGGVPLTGGTVTGGAGSTGGAGGTGGGGGTGGTSAGGTGGSSCSNVVPCGGDVVGTWTVTSSCLNVSGTLDLTPFGIGCTEAPITGSLQVTGAWSARANGTYIDQTTTTGTEQISLARSCLEISGTRTTCDGMASLLSIFGFSTVNCMPAANAGCSCTATLAQQGGAGSITPFAQTSGTYTVSNNVIETDSTLKYSYCVSGNRAMWTPKNPNPTTTGTITFQRNTSAVDGGAGGRGGTGGSGT